MQFPRFFYICRFFIVVLLACVLAACNTATLVPTKHNLALV